MQEDGSIKYRFESAAFSRIADLLKYHVETKTPVTQRSGVVLVNPISKHDKWLIQHENVMMGTKIGNGQFGDVHEAVLSSTGERVAVKRYHSNELKDIDDPLQEVDILKRCSHPNVVQLIGVCVEMEPPYIVMELIPGGTLMAFLQEKGGHQPLQRFRSMAIDACQGMEYLEQNNFIHRYMHAQTYA